MHLKRRMHPAAEIDRRLGHEHDRETRKLEVKSIGRVASAKPSLTLGSDEFLAERGGIPSKHPKKFSVAMVKRNFFRVNEQIPEKLFCQCCWTIC